MNRPLFVLRPPYRTPEPLDDYRELGNVGYRSLVLLSVERVEDLTPVRGVAAGVQFAHPSACVALLVNSSCGQIDLIRLKAHVARVRAVVVAGGALISEARRQLCCTADLSEAVLWWLASLRVPLDGLAWRALTLLLHAKPEGEDQGAVGAAAQNLGVTPRALTKAFAARQLPSPRHWVRLGEALRAALPWVAAYGGGADTGGVALPENALRTFGVPLQMFRHLLGPNPLLTAWWRRRATTDHVPDDAHTARSH